MEAADELDQRNLDDFEIFGSSTAAGSGVHEEVELDEMLKSRGVGGSSGGVSDRRYHRIWILEDTLVLPFPFHLH